MRILVVEDERDLNRIIAKRLAAAGYSVDACYNGAEALDYMAAADYDAAIFDVMMPVLDGFPPSAGCARRGMTRPCCSSRRGTPSATAWRGWTWARTTIW